MLSAVNNKSSRLLNNEENLQIFKLLGKHCQSLCTTIVQVFCTEPPHHSQWVQKEKGVLCFVKDDNRRKYFFRLFCLQRNMTVWEQEIDETMQYSESNDFFHIIEREDTRIAFNFSDIGEAKKFKKCVDANPPSLKNTIVGPPKPAVNGNQYLGYPYPNPYGTLISPMEKTKYSHFPRDNAVRRQSLGYSPYGLLIDALEEIKHTPLYDHANYGTYGKMTNLVEQRRSAPVYNYNYGNANETKHSYGWIARGAYGSSTHSSDGRKSLPVTGNVNVHERREFRNESYGWNAHISYPMEILSRKSAPVYHSHNHNPFNMIFDQNSFPSSPFNDMSRNAVASQSARYGGYETIPEAVELRKSAPVSHYYDPQSSLLNSARHETIEQRSAPIGGHFVNLEAIREFEMAANEELQLPPPRRVSDDKKRESPVLVKPMEEIKSSSPYEGLPGSTIAAPPPPPPPSGALWQSPELETAPKSVEKIKIVAVEASSGQLLQEIRQGFKLKSVADRVSRPVSLVVEAKTDDLGKALAKAIAERSKAFQSEDDDDDDNNNENNSDEWDA